MSILKILSAVFPFLFSAFRRSWDGMTATQQQAILNAGQIGQYLKSNLSLLEDDLVKLIGQETKLQPDVITGTLVTMANKFGLKTTNLNEAVTYLQVQLKGAASNEQWNGILQLILNTGAAILSGGTLTWEHIAIGIGEWAYQTFIKAKTAQ